jgi:RNA polymerase sigma-70 factor (ECF subfamily)
MISREVDIPGLRTQFQQLVDRHYDDLWRYVRRLTGGSGDSEDLLHEAFLLAFDRLASGPGFTGDPGDWLRATLRHLVCAWWREKRKLPQDVADRLKLLADEAEHAVSRVSRLETEAALAHCLAKLEPEDRALIAQRYENGLRVTQIAEQMKVNVATLRVRLFRARHSLKSCIEGQLPGWSMP